MPKDDFRSARVRNASGETQIHPSESWLQPRPPQTAQTPLDDLWDAHDFMTLLARHANREELRPTALLLLGFAGAVRSPERRVCLAALAASPIS